MVSNRGSLVHPARPLESSHLAQGARPQGKPGRCSGILQPLQIHLLKVCKPELENMVKMFPLQVEILNRVRWWVPVNNWCEGFLSI